LQINPEDDLIIEMKKFIFGLVVIFASCYWCWGYFTHTHGEQVVQYEASNKRCFGTIATGKYCIHEAKQGTNGAIAYHLHGRNLDEQAWNDDTFYTAMLQRYWQDKGVKPPIVVTISFGPVWLLTSKGKSAYSGLLNTFIEKLIPEVESKIGVPTERILFGESMGGLNAILAGLKFPASFKKIASLCPVIYKDVSPFSSYSEIFTAMNRTGAEPRIIWGIVGLAKNFISDEDEWKKLAPLKLLADAQVDSAPVYYVSAPLYDKYGNYEGTDEFVHQAQQKGLNVIWRPIYGGHCAVDIVSLGDFLL